MGDSWTDRQHHSSQAGTQACQQDQEAVQPDQGGRCLSVRHQEATPPYDGKKQKFAAPKVQRLVTPVMLQRKRHRLALKRRRGEKNRLAAAEYAKILAQRQKEAKEAKELKRRRSASLRESKRSVSSQ